MLAKAAFGANLGTFASKPASTKSRSMFITKYNKDIGINSFLVDSIAVNVSVEGYNQAALVWLLIGLLVGDAGDD